MKEVYCQEVIISTLARRGSGTKHSPVRAIVQVFEKDGTLISETDPDPDLFKRLDMICFARFLKEQGIDPYNAEPRDVEAWLDTIDNKK